MRNRRLAAWIFSFVPLIITLIVLPMIPDIIPAHYGFDGSVDRYGSKYEILILPIITVIMGAFWILMVKISLKDKEKGAQNVKVMFWCDIIMSLTFTVVTVWILYTSYTRAENIYHSDFDFAKILSICVCVCYIMLGNYLPKCKQNRLIGIRTRWTLASEAVWYKTHKFGGKVFILGGIISTALCLFFGGMIALSISFGTALIMIIPIAAYSYRIYKTEMQ